METYILRLIGMLMAVYGVYIFIGKKFIISKIYEVALFVIAAIFLISENFDFNISDIFYYIICFALLGIGYIRLKGMFFIYNWKISDISDFIEITLKKNNISFERQKYNNNYKFILLQGGVFSLIKTGEIAVLEVKSITDISLLQLLINSIKKQSKGFANARPTFSGVLYGIYLIFVGSICFLYAMGFL